MKPTTHFMTNEALHLARTDGRAYHVLQEGAKKKNNDDKQDACTSMKGIPLHTSGENPHQHILHLQQLRRVLTDQDRAPNDYQLQDVAGYLPTSPRNPIAPVVHAPAILFPV